MEGNAQMPAGAGPPRPLNLTVELYEQPDGLAVRLKRGGGPWVFLLIWLAGWTVGCVALLFMVIHQPTIGAFAFAVPFWASWVFVASLLTWMLFGRETLLLRADEALFVRSAIVRLSSRVVPRAEIQGFRECRSSHTENDQHLRGIEMVTLGKPLRLAFRLPDDERAWLIHRLNSYLTATASPGAARPFLSPPDEARVADPEIERDEEHQAETETLVAERTLSEPPTDGDWRLHDGVDEFAFEQRGRWKAATLGLLLFINLFWNGIVSVFVLVLLGRMPEGDAPQGREWWGLFLFLVPFELIGLGMFAALVLAAIGPWRRTVWRFERYRIVRRTWWPVFRTTRAWEIGELDSLELRPGGAAARSGREDADARFSLAFVSSDHAIVCEIGKLTEGDARWMGGIVLDRRRRWFAAR
jgi:hypothetical protein